MPIAFESLSILVWQASIKLFIPLTSIGSRVPAKKTVRNPNFFTPSSFTVYVLDGSHLLPDTLTTLSSICSKVADFVINVPLGSLSSYGLGF